MNKLFNSMIQRRAPAHAKNPKYFLQYMMLHQLHTRRVDPWGPSLFVLLLTHCDQEELEQCILTGLTKNFCGKIAEAAQTIEAQVIARCYGLVQISEPSGHTRVTLLDTAKESTGNHRIKRFQPMRIENLHVSFIHRTAFDFLSADDEGRAFLTSCSIQETGQAQLNFLRANIARFKYGLHFEGLDGHRIHLLEKVADQQNLKYEHLTRSWIDSVLEAQALTTTSHISENWEASRRLRTSPLLDIMPANFAVSITYALKYNLFQLLADCCHVLSEHDCQQVYFLVLMTATRLWEAGWVDFIRRNPVFANTQKIPSTAEVTAWVRSGGVTFTFSGGGSSRVHSKKVTLSVWQTLVANLVEWQLSGRSRSITVAKYVFDTIRRGGVPLSASLDLDVSMLLSESNVPWNDSYTSGRYSSHLALRCTLEEAIRLVLPPEALSTYGITHSRHPSPQVLKWRPVLTNLWLDLQPEHDIKLHHPLFQLVPEREGKFNTQSSYQLNPDYVVFPSSDQLRALATYDRMAIGRNHPSAANTDGAYVWHSASAERRLAWDDSDTSDDSE